GLVAAASRLDETAAGNIASRMVESIPVITTDQDFDLLETALMNLASQCNAHDAKRIATLLLQAVKSNKNYHASFVLLHGLSAWAFGLDEAQAFEAAGVSLEAIDRETTMNPDTWGGLLLVMGSHLRLADAASLTDH